jgi:hypothetical protein
MAEYNIYPAVDEGYNFPAEIRTAFMASTDVQAAIDARADARLDRNRQYYNYRWANDAARIAQTGMRAFDRGQQLDTGVEYRYINGAWVGNFTPYRRYADLNSLFAEASFSQGDIAIVGRFQYSNGILHNRSIWQFANNYWSPLEGKVYVEASDAAGTKAAAQAVVNNTYAGNNRAYIFDGVEFINTANYKHVYRWDSSRGVMGVRTGYLFRRGWSQWNYGPAARSNWWNPPMDIQDDPFGVCNYDNGFTAPTPGLYRASGVFGYQQATSERVLTAMSQNGGTDYWSSLPVGMRGDSPYPFVIHFNADAGTQWSFRVYHESGNDYYTIAGDNGNPHSQMSQYVVELVQPYQFS